MSDNAGIIGQGRQSFSVGQVGPGLRHRQALPPVARRCEAGPYHLALGRARNISRLCFAAQLRGPGEPGWVGGEDENLNSDKNVFQGLALMCNCFDVIGLLLG